MMRFTSALYLVLVLLTPHASVAAKQCVDIFDSKMVSVETQVSIDKAIEALAQLRISIDQEKARGSSSVVLSTLSNSFTKKEKDLQDYLAKYGILTVSELSENLKQQIARLQNKIKEPDIEARRIVESLDAIDINRYREQAIFNRVEPGKFLMGKPSFLFGKRREVSITKPFEMMATPVTQGLWRKVIMLDKGDLPLGWTLNQSPSYFKGDLLPVERVSYRDALEWIGVLNRASRGNKPELRYLIEGHQPGDTYTLPTEAEWEFVASGRGQLDRAALYGKNEERLGEYAWTVENSGSLTHPVAQKKPLIVDGKKFFDMHGNVNEWVYGWYHKTHPREPVNDPQDDTLNEKQKRTIRIGSFKTPAKDISTFSRSFLGNGETDFKEDLGFRLVREVRP